MTCKILKEDGSVLLKEDGCALLLERFWAYVKRTVARIAINRQEIARLGINQLDIAKTALGRWIRGC